MAALTSESLSNFVLFDNDGIDNRWNSIPMNILKRIDITKLVETDRNIVSNCLESNEKCFVITDVLGNNTGGGYRSKKYFIYKKFYIFEFSFSGNYEYTYKPHKITDDNIFICLKTVCYDARNIELILSGTHILYDVINKQTIEYEKNKNELQQLIKLQNDEITRIKLKYILLEDELNAQREIFEKRLVFLETNESNCKKLYI